MSLTFEDIPGWIFNADEVSAGVFEVTGRDSLGRTFGAIGIDPEDLLAKAKQYAISLITAELEWVVANPDV
jgi:hypothetical protein